jgi:hypothetical protein
MIIAQAKIAFPDTIERTTPLREISQLNKESIIMRLHDMIKICGIKPETNSLDVFLMKITNTEKIET